MSNLMSRNSKQKTAIREFQAISPISEDQSEISSNFLPHQKLIMIKNSMVLIWLNSIRDRLALCKAPSNAKNKRLESYTLRNLSRFGAQTNFGAMSNAK